MEPETGSKVIGYLGAIEFSHALRASSYVSLALCELMDLTNTRKLMDIETDSRIDAMIDTLDDLDGKFGPLIVDMGGGPRDD